MTTRIVALWSQKGGSGKTTSTINLAAEFAERGDDTRVLLVDLDDQSSLSETFRFFPKNIKKSIGDLITETPAGRSVAEAIHETDFPRISIIPATGQLYEAAEYINATGIGKEFLLKKILQPIQDGFDYILIDCPGERGFLTLNGLTAATEVLIPYEPTDHDWKTLQSKNLPYIQKVQQTTNPHLRIAGLLVTKFHRNTNISRVFLETAQQSFPGRVFNSPVPYASAAKEAIAHGQPIGIYQPNSSVRDAYRAIAEELTNHVA